MNSLKTKNYKLKTVSGFTLIELMVTLAIFTILTTVTLANFPRFNSKVALDVLAQNIALTIRRAQVYGISAYTAGGLSSPPVGVHLFGPTDSSQGKQFFFIYTDSTNPRIYQYTPQSSLGDPYYYLYANGLKIPPQSTIACSANNPDSTEECIEPYKISGKGAVSLICYNSYPIENNFNNCQTNNLVSSADIEFVRPDPSAKISAALPGNSTDNIGIAGGVLATSIDNLEIFVRVNDGNHNNSREIVVFKTGQISVLNCNHEVFASTARDDLNVKMNPSSAPLTCTPQ